MAFPYWGEPVGLLGNRSWRRRADDPLLRVNKAIEEEDPRWVLFETEKRGGECGGSTFFFLQAGARLCRHCRRQRHPTRPLRNVPPCCCWTSWGDESSGGVSSPRDGRFFRRRNPSAQKGRKREREREMRGTRNTKRESNLPPRQVK